MFAQQKNDHVTHYAAQHNAYSSVLVGVVAVAATAAKNVHLNVALGVNSFVVVVFFPQTHIQTPHSLILHFMLSLKSALCLPLNFLFSFTLSVFFCLFLRQNYSNMHKFLFVHVFGAIRLLPRPTLSQRYLLLLPLLLLLLLVARFFSLYHFSMEADFVNQCCW